MQRGSCNRAEGKEQLLKAMIKARGNIHNNNANLCLGNNKGNAALWLRSSDHDPSTRSGLRCGSPLGRKVLNRVIEHQGPSERHSDWQ